MPSILASQILGPVAAELSDPDSVRWTRAELLGWLNEAQRTVVLLRPEASVASLAIQLAAGTRQSLPATALSLVDVIRNMGPGAAPGRAIRRIPRKALDESMPDWHTAAADGVVRHYMFDPQVPKEFLVYPPQPGTGTYVEVSYSTPPTDVADEYSTIAIDDVYESALTAFVLYRAFAKDAPYGDPVKANSYFNIFTTLLSAGAAQADQMEV